MRTNPNGDSAPQDGPWEDHFRDGTLSTTGAYRAGKKTGEWMFYDSDGDVTKTKNHRPKKRRRGTHPR